MSDDISKLEFKAGDVLTAESLQAIVRAIRGPSARFVGGPGVHAVQGRDGSLSIDVPARAKYVAAVSTDFTARSGVTLGKGKVTVQVNVDGDLTATALVDLDVYHMGAGTIASGGYVQVEEFSDGYFYVTAVDCA